MKITDKILRVLAAVGLVGLMAGPVQAASAVTIQEEDLGLKFKVTNLNLNTGELFLGYYDLDYEHTDVIMQYSLVYSDELVTRAMMEQTLTARPEWGKTIANIDYVALGMQPMAIGSGWRLVLPTEASTLKQENDFRESNGRFYYAVRLKNSAGEEKYWVGGVDYTACVAEESKLCRAVSTKYGIMRVAQDYETWAVYDDLPEVETEEIDYTGWKPEVVDDAGAVETDAGPAADVDSGGWLDEKIGEELLYRELEIVRYVSAGMTEALGGVAAPQEEEAAEELGDTWVGTGDGLEVPLLGGEESGEKCYNGDMKDGLYVILAFVIAWALAQLIKGLAYVMRSQGKFKTKEFLSALLKSGGMPSGHAASFTAATLSIGCLQGFTSALFALALCMEAIVLYDAVNVRYAVGKQGKALNKLIAEPLKVVEGHTVIEVAAGILLGGMVSWAMFVLIFG